MSRAPHPPGPKGIPIVGSLFGLRRNPLKFLMGLAQEYGDLVRFQVGPQEVYLINQPDYIKDVLVTHHRNFTKSRALQMAKRFLGEGLLTSEDEFHRRQRRLVQPAFHRQRIGSYANIMVEYAARASARWHDGGTLDIGQEMRRLTLAIVGKALFDADLESEATEIGDALTSLMQIFSRLTSPFPELLERLPLPSNFRFQKAKNRLDTTIYRLIKDRRVGGRDRGDLLSMLLLAQDEEGDGAGMSDLQVRDEALTLFLAGHETTANALTWTWYLLSQHPEAEAKLHAEFDATLGGRLPTVDDVPRLRYTEMVFAEAMRLYPPAWAIGRRALDDYEIGGWVLPARSVILMSQYVTHHDRRFFPEPFRFDPDRWTPEAQSARPKFSYFPFGGGPRVCVGEPFAWMEGVLLIATLASQWQMRLSPGAAVEPQPLITLRPKHPVQMILKRRRRS